MNEFPQTNTGLIEGSGTKSLWLGGTIPYKVRLQSGDWRPYLVTEEHQYSHNTDTMGCVSFSLNNDLEIQHKFEGIDINFSDRFLAKMSGTTTNGNYLDKVADTARTIGLVLESEYPAPPSYTWASYYSEVPEDIRNKAVKMGISYERIGKDKDSLEYHLKQSPIQITIPAPYPNHAVVLVHIEGDVAYYFDTYPSYLKTIAVSKIAYALKVVLNKPLNKEAMQLKRDNGTVYLVGNKGKLGIANPETLALLNKVSDEMIDGDTSNLPDLGVIDQGLIIDFKEGV